MSRSTIDWTSTGELDLSRLGRSLELHGEQVGEGRYRVSGGTEAHWVDLYTANHPRCDCADHLWRDAVCKHILAALLREGNERVISALAWLFSQMRTAQASAAREAGTRRRRTAERVA